jgi:hypothetical protein
MFYKLINSKKKVYDLSNKLAYLYSTAIFDASEVFYPPLLTAVFSIENNCKKPKTVSGFIISAVLALIILPIYILKQTKLKK